ncbi:acid-shock protein [Paraburkholderia kururiensis]|uniref:Acid-shock protein n=1 Tax=Paraburkholderia kururiensis TaxID=984307 RepID=A0ABZ0WGJ3_9BURK|nr:acid-shock protein [Paraburkholderia kururiensis]WQD76462.1 acid-shock protein [Paraburkholderia kururiensis]
MKKLTLMLTALALTGGSLPAFAQQATPGEASAVSSYSPPRQKHVKKPKKKKMKHGASAAVTAEPAAPAASQ